MKMKMMKRMMMIVIFSLLLVHGTSTEFEVGDGDAWEVPPPSTDPLLYSHWAQKNRFILNDTLHFSYKKDSVMVVTETEYEECGSSRPLFFSNNGDTTFLLDRPGLFYFISGTAGHCERGQKMIVKVLNMDHSQDTNPSSHNDKNKSGATHDQLRITSVQGLVLLMNIVGCICYYGLGE